MEPAPSIGVAALMIYLLYGVFWIAIGAALIISGPFATGTGGYIFGGISLAIGIAWAIVGTGKSLVDRNYLEFHRRGGHG